MIVPIFLPHLGCGKRCIYCNQDVITDSTKEDGLKQRIAALLGSVESPVEVALYGGNPLGLEREPLKNLLSLFDPYRESITRLRISARPGPVDRDIIRVLKDYRVGTIELGTPTFNDRILALLSRGHTSQDSRDSVKTMKEERFETGMQVMVGLPGETDEDVKEIVSAISDLAPAFIRIYPLVVIEDTPLRGLFDSGGFIPCSLEEAVSKAAFVYVSAWSRGIPTIKMGLTENPALKARIAAGPYHPAFGYLVKSEAFRLAVTSACERLGAGRGIRVRLCAGDVAHLVGYKSSGLQRLNGAHGPVAWDTEPSLEAGHFFVEAGGRTAEASLADALA